MEGGKEQNYWPGFVDALSNVVLTLVFVLVIFVFALAMASNKIAQKLQEIHPVDQGKAVQALSDENAALKRQLAVLQAQLQSLQVKSAAGTERASPAHGAADSAQVVSSVSSKDNQSAGEVHMTAGPARIVITFPLMASEMNAAAGSAFDAAAGGILAKLPHARVVIRSYIGNESYSVANRNAYYRAVLIRGRLVEKNQVTADSIDLKTVQDKNPGDGRVEISFVAP